MFQTKKCCSKSVHSRLPYRPVLICCSKIHVHIICNKITFLNYLLIKLSIRSLLRLPIIGICLTYQIHYNREDNF